MAKTHFYTDERTFWHCTGVQALFMPIGGWVEPPAGVYGADTPASKRRLLNLVRASGLIDELAVSSAPPATPEAMLAVHTADYIERFRQVSDAGGGSVGSHAPFSQGAFEIAALSAGLAVAAVAAVMAGQAPNAYALCRPAGHHCLPDQSMGFCLLANIPIAIAAMQARHPHARVAVVDWDVHHGNGTQAIFYDRADVLTISLHQENCFPPGYSGTDDRGTGAGTGYNLNIPLPAGCGHDAYLHAIDSLVVPAIADFAPDLIIVASGFDASAVDPLARMLLHSQTYRAMTARVKALAGQVCGGRLVVVHEGGYAEAYVPFCGHALLAELAGVDGGVDDPFLPMLALQQPGPATRAFQLAAVDDLVRALAHARAAPGSE